MTIDSILHRDDVALSPVDISVPIGSRVAYFFDEPDGRFRFVPFVASGLMEENQSVILTSPRFAEAFRYELSCFGIDCDSYERDGQLLILTEIGSKPPEPQDRRFRLVRCVNDASWVTAQGWTLNDFLRFEVESHLLFQQQPCTTICQYEMALIGQEQMSVISSSHLYTISNTSVESRTKHRSISEIIFEGMDAQLRVLTKLQELSLRLTATLSLDETLDAIIDAAMSICGADRSAVSCFNEVGELRVMRSRGLSDDYLKRRRLAKNDEPVATIIRSKRPVVVDVDEMIGVSPNYEAWKSDGIRLIVTMPLISEGEVFGIIGAGSSISGNYTQTEMEAMAILAAQAGAAITTARLFEQLRGANRAKDEFLATLSHELRTPLTPILGWINILKRSAASDPVLLQQGLDTIERNARQQAELINDLLDMTRIISGKIELVREMTDLVALVRTAANQIQPQAATRSVNIDLSLPPEPVLCDVDPVRIQQVLANLLTNAVKFTPEGGSVAIAIAQYEELGDKGRHGRWVVVEVTDTGIGIEPEFIDQVFERFTQAHGGLNRRYGGLGLGLAITRALVEMHGGEINASSEGLGRGSKFTARLPVSSPLVARKPDGYEASKLFPFHWDNSFPEPLNLKLLVVEDSSDTLDMLKLWLKLFGCEVRTASTGAVGLAMALQDRPDLVISDIGMPDVDGYELIRRLRGSPGFADLPAIALTGYARNEDKDIALAAGYNAHVAKPAEMMRLYKMIKELTSPSA